MDYLRKNLVVRIRNFKVNNMPEHWVRSMISYSGSLCKIHEKYKDDYWPKERIKIKSIVTDSIDHLYFFCPSDFEKANTNDTKKIET